jgi:inorganic triphosphatase YgiF
LSRESFDCIAAKNRKRNRPEALDVVSQIFHIAFYSARAPEALMSTSPKEIELKLEVPPAVLPDLNKIPLLRGRKKPADSEFEESVYFDTKTQKLRRSGLMLRVRRIGKRHIQTIKAVRDSQLFERDEWEWEIPGAMPDLRLARGTALERLLSNKLRQRLQPIFETRVRRTSYELIDDGRDVLMTLDKGRIVSDKRSEAISEIELELERGRADDLFDIARQLVDKIPAQLAIESKSERGYRLLEGEDTAPVRAARVNLRPGVTTADGFRIIGQACLRQIVGNLPALRAGEPEGVHQMRVGLRRLRAAMSLFGDILRDPETAAIKQEVKWLTNQLARARELEVLVTQVVAPIKQRNARWAGLARISHDLAVQRAAAIARAKEAVQSVRFRRFLIAVAAWLETGQWSKPQDELIRDRAESPLATLAAAELARRWKKLRKKGRALRELDPRGRHKVRIQAKKLRYAAEFFADLFSGKRASRQRKAFMARLKDLQDCLGDLNDIVVHEQLITANAGLAEQQTTCNRAFAAGLLTGHEDARFETVLAGALDAAQALAKAEPFWR